MGRTNVEGFEEPALEADAPTIDRQAQQESSPLPFQVLQDSKSKVAFYQVRLTNAPDFVP